MLAYLLVSPVLFNVGFGSQLLIFCCDRILEPLYLQVFSLEHLVFVIDDLLLAIYLHLGILEHLVFVIVGLLQAFNELIF